MVGLTTRIINRYVDGIPRRDPIIINWIKCYLKSSYKINDSYFHYKGNITHYYSVIDLSKAFAHKTNRLLVYNGNMLVADIGIYKFKRYCRTYLIKNCYEVQE